MNVQLIASIVASVSTLLETVVAAQVAGDESAEAKVSKVFAVIDTIGGIAGHGLSADAALTERLQRVKSELDDLNAVGADLTEGHFVGLGERTLQAEAELQATVARRRALARSAT